MLSSHRTTTGVELRVHRYAFFLILMRKKIRFGVNIMKISGVRKVRFMTRVKDSDEYIWLCRLLVVSLQR